ncbi:MAG: hypothetical protein M1438_13680 [Deltaproteobacteria bacterium]|nr:hypothetical protein [Deltaproteobacteria bacterium]
MAKQTLNKLVLVMLVLGAVALAGSAHAGMPGTWTPTGSLNTGRSGHTATLLNDGRVLVVAGTILVQGPLGPIVQATNSAEIYHPTNKTWTTASSLNPNFPRSLHTATRLPDGRVLVAGGQVPSPGGILHDVEIYDPSSDTWTTAASLNGGRYGHTATLLNDGRVLVAGGATAPPFQTYRAEIYDPAANSWTLITPMNSARVDHTANLLADGKVLVAGGGTDSTELFDPTQGTWTTTGPLNNPLRHHTATLLTDGRVLVAGGEYFDSTSGTVIQVNSVVIYDPATGTWAITGPLTTPRTDHKANLLEDGQVLISGGAYQDSSGAYIPLNSAEIYDPDREIWTLIGPLNTARYRHTATLLANGRVLATGGSGASGILNSAEVYKPEHKKNHGKPHK